jgi:hypothetical protein
MHFNYLLLLILQSMNVNVLIEIHSTICKTLISHKNKFGNCTLQNGILSTSVVMKTSHISHDAAMIGSFVISRKMLKPPYPNHIQ